MEATPLEDKVSWRYCPNPTIMKQSREVICIHEYQAKNFFTPKVNLLYNVCFIKNRTIVVYSYALHCNGSIFNETDFSLNFCLKAA